MTAATAAEFAPAEVVDPPVETPPETPEEALDPAPSYKPSGIADLIWRAKTSPPKPVIRGLLHEKEIAGLHGAPEVFKTIFTLQLAECLATGKPFLGVWQVPRPRRVYFLETEMHETALGSRLVKMYANQTPPDRIYFADEAQLKQFHRATDLRQKFALFREWLREAKADVAVLDTANPFFRGKESPNDETTAGAFFDLLTDLPAKAKLFVRHNHKPRMDDSGGDAAMRIRGSGQFSDVPDLLLELSRKDKRTNEATLSVSKYRHGSKPDDLSLWLDAGTLRLVSVPPVIHLLQSSPLTRRQLLAALDARFGIKQRKADELIREQQPYVVENMGGHERLFDLDWKAAQDAEWHSRLEAPLGRR
jgi:AAA domain